MFINREVAPPCHESSPRRAGIDTAEADQQTSDVIDFESMKKNIKTCLRKIDYLENQIDANKEETARKIQEAKVQTKSDLLAHYNEKLNGIIETMEAKDNIDPTEGKSWS